MLLSLYLPQSYSNSGGSPELLLIFLKSLQSHMVNTNTWETWFKHWKLSGFLKVMVNSNNQWKYFGHRKFVKPSQCTISGLTIFKKQACCHTLCPWHIKEPYQKAFLPYLKKKISEDGYISQPHNSCLEEGQRWQQFLLNVTVLQVRTIQL